MHRSSAIGFLAALPVAVVSFIAQPAAAQHNEPLVEINLSVKVDSGWVRNDLGQRGVIWSAEVVAPLPEAAWVRLNFAEVVLGRTPAGGEPTMLRLTSLLDGKQQRMHAIHLEQWRNTSAYFNGGAVLVEIVADAGAPASRLVMSEMIAGPPNPNAGGIATLCGADDRVLSSDPRAARALPGGCTAWLFNDYNHTFLTAGHCVSPGLTTIEFNVPLSTTTGGLNHPGPEDQYAVDASSRQWLAGGLGNDWCYFGCFPNSNTGLTPFQAQQAFYTLAPVAPPVNAQTIRITGYGTDTTPSTHNQVQQTNAGPYFTLTGTIVRYQTDTMGGNSGSAILDEATNTAIGIHTNGGCTSTGGSNSGCAIHATGLQSALANPLGVCIPIPPIDFIYPDGLPSQLDPAGDSIRVHVIGANGGAPQRGTGQLHYDVGSGFVAAPMIEVSPNIYDAVFPATACRTSVRFYLSAQSSTSEVVTDPQINPVNNPFAALSATGLTVVVNDQIEGSVTGWSVVSDPTLTTGAWQQADPVGTTNAGALAAPENDHTPAPGVQCFVTQNGVPGGGASVVDIDGGGTNLISPVIDLLGTDAVVSFAQWFYSSGTTDRLRVSVSNDDGATWTEVAQTASTAIGGVTSWQVRSFVVGDFVVPSAQVRVRFRGEDVTPGNVVEAGIDDFRVDEIECQQLCPADITGDNMVDVNDLLAVVGNWGASGPNQADVNGDLVVNVNDLLAVVGAWGPCA